MSELLQIFDFRTGLPFGYATFFLGLLMVLAAGLFLLVKGLGGQTKRMGMAAGGATSILFVVVLLAGNMVASELLDLNPDVRSDMLSGEWIDGPNHLDLRPDGGFELRAPNLRGVAIETATGTWRNASGDLHLTTHGGPKLPEFRVIRYADDLRIIVQDFDDPDMWDGHLGFRRGK